MNCRCCEWLPDFSRQVRRCARSRRNECSQAVRVLVNFIKIPTEQISERHRCSKGITSPDRVGNVRGHALVLRPPTVRKQKTAVRASGQSHELKGITVSEFSEF